MSAVYRRSARTIIAARLSSSSTAAQRSVVATDDWRAASASFVGWAGLQRDRGLTSSESG